MKRRILSLLLALCMVMSLLPTTALASEAAGSDVHSYSNAAVAEVNGTKYDNINDAIAAWTNNTTLTLLANVTLSDVITLNSTEHHILNLGTYTMTAASGKNAIVIKACGTGGAERTAITINADATNPGGINAGSKSVVYYKYADGGISTDDRPIIKINGGVFTGSTSSFGTAGIYTIGTAARKCATLNISGGTFNCSINGSGKSKLIITGGTFNYSVGSQGDSTALRLISGGTFKTFGFMTADSNNTKFWFGTSMGNSNVGVHVDDNGYIVVGGPVISDAGETFEASSANYGGASNLLQYSSAKNNGLYYTSVEEALADNNTASGSVTVYVDELDMTGINYKGSIVVPEGNDITITNAPSTLKVNLADGTVLTPNEDGTLTTIVPKQVEVDTQDELLAALANGGTVKLIGDIYTTANEEDDVFLYILTGADAVLDLNGHKITPADEDYCILICGDLTITDTSEAGNGSIVAKEQYLSAEYTYVDGHWTDAPVVTINGGIIKNLSVGDETTVVVNGGDVTLYLYQPDYFYEQEEYDNYMKSLTLIGEFEINLPDGYVLGEDGSISAPASEIKVGTFAELQAALADNTNDLPILITATIEIPGARSGYVLDLNGKTVNAAENGAQHIYALKNYGALTITDGVGGGSINSRGIYNYGTLILESGTINAIDGNGGYAVNNQSGSTFIMNGGVVATTNEDDHQSSSGGYDATALKVPADATATLNGGKIVSVTDFTYAVEASGTLNIPATSTIEISGAHGAIAVQGGKTTIDAGSFSVIKDNYVRTDNVLYVSGGELVVNGGTFTGDSDTAASGSCVCDVAGSATINGGSFSGSVGGDVWGETGTTIKGGTFANLTEKQHIAPGYELNENGTVVADKVYVAEVNGEKFENYADALAALESGDELKILVPGSYKIPSGKNVTVTGAVEGVVFEDIGAYAMGGASVTFNNVTFNYSMTAGYMGLQHSGDLVYNNCTFNGQVFLYGTSETFNNCVFNNTDVNNYNVWTYAAKEVTFNGCTFNSAGRSVLVYGEGNIAANIAVEDCEFYASTAVDGKAALEIDSSAMSAVNLTITNSTATGFGNGSVSGNSLWNNKKGNDTPANNDITVVVNGETVLKPVFYVAEVGGVKYESLEDAFKAATSGCTIDILADVVVDYYWDARNTGAKFTVPVTINGNGHTIKFTNTVYDAGNYLAAFRFETDATVKDLTIDMSQALSGFAGRFRAISAKTNLVVDGCTFIGNGSNNNTRAIIFGEGASSATSITITNSEFEGWRRAISDNESGRDIAANIVITGNTVEDAGVYVSATTSVTFNNNTVAGGYVDIRSYTANNTLNVTATGNTLEANTETNYNSINAGGTITAQSEFVVPAKGTVTPAFTGSTTIWGEGGGNAKESFVIKLYSGETLLATASLNNIGGIIDGDVYVSWNIPLNKAGNDEYWDIVWTNYITADTQPTKVVLEIDGVEVAENNYQLNSPDDLNKIYAATVDADGEFVQYFTSLEAAAQAGNEIIVLADVTLSEILTLPAGITLNGNGKQINGEVWAAGDLTFKGHTKIAKFNAGYNKPVITIGVGATLETTSGRMVIGHGATFNIVGNIIDAKSANVADLTPSLIAPGASFTGAGVNFNVTNAYIKFTAYCSSKNNNASSTFNFNVNNSIWQQTGSLVFTEPTNGKDPTFNFYLTDSVLESTSHLVFAVTKGEIVFDNSNVNVGTSRQLENRSTMTIKNGSVVNGAVATSSNAKNPGTIIVDNATYAVTGEFSGSDVGTGTLIVKKGAKIAIGSITKANIVVDGTGMTEDDVIDLTANLNKFAGTLTVINNDDLEAKIVDGKIVLAVKPVAKIGDTYYTSLAEAIAAAQNGDTITLLTNVTDAGIIGLAAGVTLDGNGKTISGNSCVYMAASGETAVKNVNFKAIHNDSNKLSAIYATGLTSDAKITITGCTFENIDWDSIQITSVDDSKPTVAITGNMFLADTDTTALQYRHVHMELGATTRSKIDFTLENNKFYGKVYMSPLALYYIDPNGSTLNIDKNYIEFTDRVSVVLSPAGASSYNANELILPLYDESLTNKLSFEAVVVKDKYNAKIYATLAEAVAAAQAGDTIKLLTSVTITELIKIEKAITLDLNGKKVTATSKKAFEVYANATIMNGTIEAAQRCVDTRKAVELTLTDVTLVADKYTSYGNPQPLTIGGSENGTKVTMTNVNISAAAGYGIITFVKTELTATNSTIGGYSALYVKPGSEGSKFNFVNSTLSGSTAGNDVEGNSFSTIAVRADDVTVNVDADSTVTATGNYCYAISLDSKYTNENGITGANITVAGAINGKVLTSADVDNNTITVKAEYAAQLQNAGYGVVIANGMATAVVAVASVNGTYYATFAEALAAAQAGDTVVILAGEYTVDIDVNKAITVVGETDADGNNLVNITGNVSVFSGATVKNLNVHNTKTGEYDCALNVNGANIVIDGVKLTGYNAMRYCYATGNITIKNSTINGSNFAVHFDGKAGGNIAFENCDITGWVSFASTINSVSYTDCKLDQGNTAGHRYYNKNISFTDCDFAEGFKIDLKASGTNVAFTDDNMNLAQVEALFKDPYYVAKGNITLNEAKVAYAASVYVNGSAKYFMTLQEAIDAAPNGNYITLRSDNVLTAPITIPAGKKVTIGTMNGFTITYTSDKMGEAMITNNGDLTLDEVKVIYTYTGAADSAYGKGNYTIANNGKLTITSNATIENATAKMPHASYAITNGNGGEIVLKSGLIKNTNNYAVRMFGNGSLTVNGGEIIGTRAVWMQAPGSNTADAPAISLTVNGGKLTSTGESDEYKLAVYSYTYGNSLENVSITVNGGVIDGDIALSGGMNKTVAEKVTITGGTITNVYSYATEEVAANTINISGGAFLADVSDLLVEGLHLVENEGVYTICKHEGDITLDAVAPDCVNTGLTEGKQCSTCGKILVAQETIAELGHTNNELVVAPSCINGGCTIYTCTVCGNVTAGNYVPVVEHSFTEVVEIVKPTNTTNGYTVYKCASCDETETRDVVAALTKAVAEFEGEYYNTLIAALAAAKKSTSEEKVITMVRKQTGAALVIDIDVTIDFGNFAYTVNAAENGAAVVIAEGAIVTLKNGTIQPRHLERTLFNNLIVNNGNLTTKDITLRGDNLGAAGERATIVNNGTLKLDVGTVVATNMFALVATENVTKDVTVELEAPVGYYWDNNTTLKAFVYEHDYTFETVVVAAKSNRSGYTKHICACGESIIDSIVSCLSVCAVNETTGVEYWSLAEAVADAKDGETVKLLKKQSGAALVINANITIDLGTFTYTVNADKNGAAIVVAENAAAVITNGAVQMLFENRTNFNCLVNNLGALEATDITLKATNAYAAGAVAFKGNAITGNATIIK